VQTHDAIALLKTDHAAVKKLFESEKKLNKADGKKKEAIFNQIKAALEVHATIEEEIFYPAVKAARAENVKDEVREAYEVHKQIKSLLAQIAALTSADETYDMKIKVLMEDVEHHVKEEETEMFPDAKKFLGEKRLVELGAELEARKQQLEKHPASRPALGNQPAARSGRAGINIGAVVLCSADHIRRARRDRGALELDRVQLLIEIIVPGRAAVGGDEDAAVVGRVERAAVDAVEGERMKIRMRSLADEIPVLAAIRQNPSGGDRADYTVWDDSMGWSRDLELTAVFERWDDFPKSSWEGDLAAQMVELERPRLPLAELQKEVQAEVIRILKKHAMRRKLPF
jgi:hemerythrin superfamily protein